MAKLAIVLTEGFADWECAQLLGAARGYYSFEVVAATPGGTAVTSGSGLHVTPDADAMTLSPEGFGALVLCGGPAWQADGAPDIADLVARFADAGAVIAAICDAVVALARTGRLDAVPHTGNDRDQLAAAPHYAGQARYEDGPRAVRVGKLVTAAGVAPVSFMAETLAALGVGGPDLAVYTDMLAAEHRATA